MLDRAQLLPAGGPARPELDFYNAFIDAPLDVRDGHLHVSRRPGLGLEIDLDYLRAHAVDGWGG